MARALTSWKEIAQHLGKGVRTVQRWEHEGLPIRRPSSGQRGRVLAYDEELDQWLRSAFQQNAEGRRSQTADLRKAVEQLLAENECLRRELNALMAMPMVPDLRAEGSLLHRCSRALEQSVLLRQRCVELKQRHVMTRQECGETVDSLTELIVLMSTAELRAKES